MSAMRNVCDQFLCLFQYLHSLMALTSSEIDTSKTGGHRDRLEKIGMSLEALRNVIKASPGNYES